MSSCLHRYFDEIPRKGIFINTKVKGMLFSILSKVMPIPTTSIEGDKVLLNGGKIFCTNAGQSLYYTVNCKTKPPMPRLRAPILWSWSPPTRRASRWDTLRTNWAGTAPPSDRFIFRTAACPPAISWPPFFRASWASAFPERPTTSAA